MTVHLSLALLGTWRAAIDHEPLPDLPTRHSRLLLAQLALAYPASLDRNGLCATLFPHAPVERALPHLRSTLYYLRRALAGQRQTILCTRGRRIGLCESVQLSLDVSRFLQLSAPGAPRTDLQQAMCLYRGPFLQGEESDWVVPEQQRLHGRYVDVLLRLIALARAAGQPQHAVGAALRWAESEPWSDEAHFAAIELLMDTGDGAAAARQLQTARRALQNEEAWPPNPRLARLARRIDRLSDLQPAAPLCKEATTATAAGPSIEQQTAPAKRLPAPDAGPAEWRAALDAALQTATAAHEAGELRQLGQALETAARAVDRLGLAQTDPARWSLLLLQDEYHVGLDRTPEWEQTLQQMETAAREANDPERLATAFFCRGRALRSQGDPAAAVAPLRGALLHAQRAGLVAEEGRALQALAVVLDDLGRIDEALTINQAALSAARRVGKPSYLPTVQANLAYSQMRAGRVEDAHALLSDSLQRALADGNRQWEALITRQLGVVHFARRRYDQGFALVRRSIGLSHDTGDQGWALAGQSYLVFELANCGRYHECIDLGDALLSSARAFGDARLLALLLDGLACARLALGDPTHARELALEGADLAGARGLREYAVLCLGVAANAEIERARLPGARQLVQRLESLAAEISDPRAVSMHHVAARLWLAVGARDAAARAAQKALEHAHDEGLLASGAVEVRYCTAGVLEALGDPQTARRLRAEARKRLADDLMHIADPALRRAFAHANPAHRELLAAPHDSDLHIVRLPARRAPAGRPLHDDEITPVVWSLTLAAEHAQSTKAERRQQQILACIRQATEQGAETTVEALASGLGVSKRTVLRDLKVLRARGHAAATRGTR